MDIYVLINNQPHGPYTQDLIRQYLASGQLQPTDLAALAGSADWKPLSVMMKSWGNASASPSKVVGKGTSFGSTPAAAGPPKKSSKTVPLVIALVLLLLAGGAGFAYWKFFGNSGPTVKVVTPPEPGIPNTLAELNAWYVEPPAGQNAATFFAQGFEATQIADADRNSKDLPGIGKGAWPALGSPLPARTKAALAGLVQRNKVALDAFQQGTKCESSRYPLDFNKGFEVPLPDLSKIKSAAQLEGLAAALYADNRAPDAAAGAVRTSLAIGQSLKDEPALISQLVRVACLALARVNLERVVNSVALRPVDLDPLAAAVDKAEAGESPGTPFTRALAGERASMLSFFDLPPDKRDEFAKTMTAASSGQEGAVQSLGFQKLMRNAKSQRAFAEETLNRTLVMRKQSFPERLKVDAYLTARAVEAKSNDFLLCTMTLPALGKQTSKEAGGLAQLRLMQTAIALERYRAANNNRYPAGLAELSPKFIPAVPQDPFTGDSLGYKKTATGYELSSAGPEPGKGSTFTVVKPPPAVAASAPTGEAEYLKDFKDQVALPPEAVAFETAKEAQVSDLARQGGFELPTELKNYFAAAKAGHAAEARKLYNGFNSVGGLLRDTNSPLSRSPVGEATLDSYLGIEAFASSDASLLKTLGNDLMSSLPAGCIYFGGTDPGRGLPSMLCKAPGAPVFVLTQNQLANGRYLDYARELYGSRIWLPTTNDVQQCMEAYYVDAQQRAAQNKLDPGEEFHMENGKPKADGFIAGMKIAGIVAKLIFDKNPGREFYIEQSYPIAWMNPYLSPRGLVFKINRQPVAIVPANEVKAQADFWKAKIAELKANPAFAGDHFTRMSYAHDCAAIGSIYGWRAQNAKDPGERQPMFDAATNTFEQALVFSPGLPEGVYVYASLLLNFGKPDAALAVAQRAAQADPANTQIQQLVSNLEQMAAAKR